MAVNVKCLKNTVTWSSSINVTTGEELVPQSGLWVLQNWSASSSVVDGMQATPSTWYPFHWPFPPNPPQPCHPSSSQQALHALWEVTSRLTARASCVQYSIVASGMLAGWTRVGEVLCCCNLCQTTWAHMNNTILSTSAAVSQNK